ncbi:MAG TPA: hypothetical protein VFI06_02215 [Chitinophagaceae bacterium]|nr:hypothetical protein [Chitinophagaceae bacterium]
MKKLLLLSGCLAIISALKAQNDPPPPPPPPPPPNVEITKYVPPTKELNEFYKKNPDVAKLYWRSDKVIVVVHKDKTKSMYNISGEKEKNAFEEKYGKAILKILPPPPPPPPAPPKKVS